MNISVVIPTISPRVSTLARAADSVESQTRRADRLIVVRDSYRSGAAITRESGLSRVDTDWVAFLDDDDYFYPHHLETLERTALETGADYVFSWFDTCGSDPFPTNEHRPWSYEEPHQTTMTILVRTDLAKSVGFLKEPPEPTPDGNRAGEDWAFTLWCLNEGAKVARAPGRTWHYCHHACGTGLWNTSGLPHRW